VSVDGFHFQNSTGLLSALARVWPGRDPILKRRFRYIFKKKKKLKEPEFGLVQVTLDLAGLFKFIWVYC